MTVKYKNPPINELIIGAYLDQPMAFMRSEHVGLFWSEVRKDFPRIQQQGELAPPIIGPMHVQIGFTDEPYPMPRYWLISKEDDIILQIQKNAVLLNWRKRGSNYPHFETVKNKFDDCYTKLSNFVKRELRSDLPRAQILELTYSNVVESTEYWHGPRDSSKVLPGIHIPSIGLDLKGDPDFNYQMAYRLASDLNLNVSVRTGRKAGDTSVAVLIFEFRAIGAVGSVDKEAADEWYGRAHETIGRCFSSMTSPAIQSQYWLPE